MKKMRLLSSFIGLLIALILFTGCGKKSVEDKLYGIWEISALLSNADIKKFSKESMPDGLEIEIAIKGMLTYHRGGKYNSNSTMTMRIKTVEGEIALKVLAIDAGEWSLHNDGKELVATSIDGTITPLDELTENILAQSPALGALMKPVKGLTSTSQILSISDKLMEVQEKGTNITFIASKKH